MARDTPQPYPIVVGTCKTYGSVVQLWHRAAELFWPDAASRAILCTDSDPGISDFPPNRVYALEAGWCERLIACLETFENDLVAFVLDDYILEAPVSQSGLTVLAKQMQSDPSIGVIYLTDIGLPAETKTRTGLFEVSSGPYSINSCPGLWRRKFLIETLKHFNDPWAWEAFAFGTPAARQWRTVCWGPSLYNYSFKTGGLIYRGAISRVALRQIEKMDALDANLSELTGFDLEKESTAAKRTLAWKLRFLRTGWGVSAGTMMTFLWKGFQSRRKIRKVSSGIDT